MGRYSWCWCRYCRVSPSGTGVIRAEYPLEEDLRIGGARTNHVRIVSPKYEKVCFGIDDTDTKQEGATWVMALKCAEACHVPGVEFLGMRLIQLQSGGSRQNNKLCRFSAQFCRPFRKHRSTSRVRQHICRETYLLKGHGIAFARGIGAIKESRVLKAIKTEIVPLKRLNPRPSGWVSSSSTLTGERGGSVH